MKQSIIYINGGCSPILGHGSFAFLIYSEHKELLYQGSGGDLYTTNNQMELTAAIEALKAAQKYGFEEVTIHTDSQYLYKGITKWIHGWRRNRWLTGDRKPVKNSDLWFELGNINQAIKTNWKLVRNSATSIQNRHCDKISYDVMMRQRASGSSAPRVVEAF